MDRRLFLKLLGTIPLVGWLVPKVKAEPPKIARFVGDTGELPPKFKWVLDGELIEWPTKTHCEKIGYPVPENLMPDCIYVRIHSIDPDWYYGKSMNLKPGDHYSWPDTVFTRANKYPPLSEAEVDSFGLRPQPVPPLGTKVRLMMCRYVTSAGYYSYGYYAKVV